MKLHLCSLLMMAHCLCACGKAVTFAEAEHRFDANKAAFQHVTDAIRQCGAKVFRVDGDQSADESCNSGRDQAGDIEHRLEVLGVEYVNVERRNFGGSNEMWGVRYILSRDQLGRGGDAQSIVWRSQDASAGQDERHRPLSQSGWFFEEIG